MNVVLRIIVILLAFTERNEIISSDVSESIEEDGKFSKDLKVFDSFNHPTPIEDYPNVCDDYKSETCAKEWIQKTDIIRKRNGNRLSNIDFSYATNLNKHNRRIKIKAQKRNIAVYRNVTEKLHKFQWHHFQSPQLKRVFNLSTFSVRSNNESLIKRLLNISHNIQEIYHHGRPCFGHCLKKGESDIVDMFSKEKNYEKLLGFWLAWRNETGRKIRNLFIERMNLQNEAAVESGFSDLASFMLQKNFEEENFKDTILNLYDEIRPLYKELHGYVRHCLLRFYPGKFNRTGPIPAHILGNVWAQQWNNIVPILRECLVPENPYNIEEEANKNLRSFSVKRMFQIAEEFFISMGMYKMTSKFWERSVFTRVSGKLMDCHASAHNFVNGQDFRIKMCAEPNFNDLYTIHHEMGHIEYFMAYRNLPLILQGSANVAFHEAVGDTIALSVRTPKHLKRLGLISEIPKSEEFDIDFLLTTALEKIVFLPFALTVDTFIWSVYNGSVPGTKLNQYWWDLRLKYQGLKPPIQRTEHDFDPGAKYHIALGHSYIRYFISFILQFQFYESMCKLSGHSSVLHRCDFYGSKEAGNKLLEMLKKGKSEHWKDSLEILTGSRTISSKSLVKYFRPLYKWLKITNKRLGIPIGW